MIDQRDKRVRLLFYYTLYFSHYLQKIDVLHDFYIDETYFGQSYIFNLYHFKVYKYQFLGKIYFYNFCTISRTFPITSSMLMSSVTTTLNAFSSSLPAGSQSSAYLIRASAYPSEMIRFYFKFI